MHVRVVSCPRKTAVLLSWGRRTTQCKNLIDLSNTCHAAAPASRDVDQRGAGRSRSHVDFHSVPGHHSLPCNQSICACCMYVPHTPGGSKATCWGSDQIIFLRRYSVKPETNLWLNFNETYYSQKQTNKPFNIKQALRRKNYIMFIIYSKASAHGTTR